MEPKSRRGLLIIFAALMVLVWGAVLASYCGLPPYAHSAEAGEGTEFFQVLGLRFKITDALLSAFTGLLALFTWQLVRTGERQREHNLTSERAYVKMSHYPPGLARDDRDGSGLLRIRIENFGRTPATVTDVVLNRWLISRDSSLPAVPHYWKEADHDPMRAFLVINDSFGFWQRYEIPSLVWAGKANLWLVGYVDYTDAFGRQFRAGYARRYKANRDIRDHSIYPTDEAYRGRNNLVLDAPEGYNYDLPLSEAPGGTIEVKETAVPFKGVGPST